MKLQVLDEGAVLDAGTSIYVSKMLESNEVVVLFEEENFVYPCSRWELNAMVCGDLSCVDEIEGPVVLLVTGIGINREIRVIDWARGGRVMAKGGKA